MIEHKYNVILLEPDALEVTISEMENDPYLMQFNATVTIAPSEHPGYHDLVITMPAEGEGGTFGTSVNMFIARKIENGQWFVNPFLDEEA